MNVFINNRQRHVGTEKISFSTIVLYGLYGLPHFERIAPTVTYRYVNQTENTALKERSSIRVQEGMHFSVINGKKVGAMPAIREGPVINPPRVMVKPEALARRKQEFAAKGLDWPPNFTDEQKAAETERVRLLMAPHEARYQAEQALKAPLSDELSARLKDAYIIINLMYQDMVIAGLHSPGRAMAGRLLYSEGYGEMVKKLEMK